MLLPHHIKDSIIINATTDYAQDLAYAHPTSL